jgi:hypothetical protein
MPSITDFKGALADGGARPNQFKVQLTYPSGVAGGANQGKSEFLVTGAALPASTVNPAIIQYRGREVKFAGERIFDPWTITVVNDSDFSIHKAIENWMELMNQKEDNSGEVQWANYTVPLTVDHLDRNDNVIRSYTLEDAFPINLSEIALQFAQNDIIEEFTVTFQYQHYLDI